MSATVIRPSKPSPLQRKLLDTLKSGGTIRGRLTVTAERKVIGLGRIVCSEGRTVSIDTILAMKRRGWIEPREVFTKGTGYFTAYRDYRITAKGRKA